MLFLSATNGTDRQTGTVGSGEMERLGHNIFCVHLIQTLHNLNTDRPISSDSRCSTIVHVLLTTWPLVILDHNSETHTHTHI